MAFLSALALAAAPAGARAEEAEKAANPSESAEKMKSAEKSAETGHEGATRAGPEKDAVQMTVVMPVYEISAGELAADPDQYYGRMVAVRADVAQSLNDHVFTLDEDRLGASPDVLVLNPAPARAAQVDANLKVVGIVRPFVRTEIERDYDWFEAQPHVDVEFKARPVIVAASIKGSSGSELVAQPSSDGGSARQEKQATE